MYTLLPNFQEMHKGFYCMRKLDDGAVDTHLHVISQFYLPKFLWICILSGFMKSKSLTLAFPSSIKIHHVLQKHGDVKKILRVTQLIVVPYSSHQYKRVEKK